MLSPALLSTKRTVSPPFDLTTKLMLIMLWMHDEMPADTYPESPKPRFDPANLGHTRSDGRTDSGRIIKI